MGDTCRSCHAPVIWLEHVRTGKRAPIDAVAAPEGNIVVNEAAGTYRIAENRDLVDREPLHTNHFATCPQSAAWRERSAKAGRP